MSRQLDQLHFIKASILVLLEDTEASEDLNPQLAMALAQMHALLEAHLGAQK